MLLPLTLLLLAAPAAQHPQRVDVRAVAAEQLERMLAPLRADGWHLEPRDTSWPACFDLDQKGRERSGALMLPETRDAEVLELALACTRRLLARFDVARPHHVAVLWQDADCAAVIADVDSGRTSFDRWSPLLEGTVRFGPEGDAWVVDGREVPLLVMERLWSAFVAVAGDDDLGALIVEHPAEARWRGWAVTATSSILARGPVWAVPIDVDVVSDEVHVGTRVPLAEPRVWSPDDLLDWRGRLPDGRVLRAFGLEDTMCDAGRKHTQRPPASVGDAPALLVAGRLLRASYSSRR